MTSNAKSRTNQNDDTASTVIDDVEDAAHETISKTAKKVHDITEVVAEKKGNWSRLKNISFNKKTAAKILLGVSSALAIAAAVYATTKQRQELVEVESTDETPAV